jgi:hypothetical protein
MIAAYGQVVGKYRIAPGFALALPFTARHLIDPPPERVQWQVVLILASHLAGFAPAAGGRVKEEGVTRHLTL